MNAGLLRKIYGLARSAGWDNDMLHEVASSIPGFNGHISKMTVSQANDLIDILIKARHGTVEQKQAEKIFKLGYLLHWDCRAIRKFNKKTTGKWDIYDCSVAEASKLISAMEAVLRWEKDKKTDHE